MDNIDWTSIHNNSQFSDSQSKTKSCFSKCIIFCDCFKFKSQKQPPENISELNYILSNKKNLLKLDNHYFSNKDSFDSPFRIKKTEKPKTPFHKNGLPVPNTTKPVLMTSNQRQKGISRSQTIKKEPNREEKKYFHEFKDKLRCFFCGGQGCKHENFMNNIKNNNAIYGLHSTYITDDIIASQRPSEALIKKYKLLSLFQELNIGLIVNLQREGEHPYCGPNAHNLTSSGYSYNPSMFTGNDIKCKLSGWKDMSVPSSMNFMLDIVKEMSIVVTDMHKKALVHCHAGYGRTGVVIACYILFSTEYDSNTAINIIRAKRHKCIETKDQRIYCKKFEDFINNSRMLFDSKQAIDVYWKRQEDIWFGEESKKYGFIPKIITKTLEKINLMKTKYTLDNWLIYKLFKGLLVEWTDEWEDVLWGIKNTWNKNNWEWFDQTENLVLIIELLYDWFEDSVVYIISPEKTEAIITSDIFIEGMKQITDKKHQNIQANEKLFNYIRKVFHCYEYEILFQLASFFALIPPKTKEEKEIFIEMLDRLSLELLGFCFNDINNDNEYMKSTEVWVTGWTSIIKLIYDSLTPDNTEKDVKLISPFRKNSLIFSSQLKFSKKDLPVSSSYFEKLAQSSAPQTSGNPFIGQQRNSLFSNSNTPNASLSQHNLINKSNIMVDPKEKKWMQMYEALQQHFQNKVQNLDVDNISSMNLQGLNEIICEGNTSNNLYLNLKPNELAKVMEEALSKKSKQESGSSSSSSFSDKNCSIILNKQNTRVPEYAKNQFLPFMKKSCTLNNNANHYNMNDSNTVNSNSICNYPVFPCPLVTNTTNTIKINNNINISEHSNNNLINNNSNKCLTKQFNTLFPQNKKALMMNPMHINNVLLLTKNTNLITFESFRKSINESNTNANVNNRKSNNDNYNYLTNIITKNIPQEIINYREWNEIKNEELKEGELDKWKDIDKDKGKGKDKEKDMNKEKQSIASDQLRSNDFLSKGSSPPREIKNLNERKSDKSRSSFKSRKDGKKHLQNTQTDALKGKTKWINLINCNNYTQYLQALNNNIWNDDDDEDDESKSESSSSARVSKNNNISTNIKKNTHKTNE